MAAVIAEVGSNWDPDNFEVSWQAMIRAAADAGADFVKGQDWYPLAQMGRPEGWKQRCAPWTLRPEQSVQASKMASDAGLRFIVSAFTGGAASRALVSEFRPLKIASSEIRNHDLLRAVNRLARKRLGGYPVWLSLGEARTRWEIMTAISLLNDCSLTLVACVSEYPVGRPLALMDALIEAQAFGLPVGVSSHVAYPDCLGIIRAAVLKGAGVVEVHLRIPGVTPENAPDNGLWALTPEQLGEVVAAVRAAERKRNGGFDDD